MKKFFAALLALCLIIPTAFASGSPPIYLVTDDEGHALYLYGTIHVGDENTYDYIESLYDTLTACDQLALEIDPIALQSDVRLSFKVLSSMYLKQDDSILNYLSEETVNLGLKMLDEPQAFLMRVAPAMWYTLAQEASYEKAGFSSDYGVDSYLAGMAYSENIDVIELESFEEQYELLCGLSDELYDFMIYSLLSDLDGTADQMKAMYEAWSVGDEKALADLFVEETVEIPTALEQEYAEYTEKMLTARDDGFLEDAVKWLKSGKTTFIAIGAAHIVGENGLVSRLRALGYTVEIVEKLLLADVFGDKQKG